MESVKSKILVIVGPTASGKTKYSLEVAKKYNAEIISADSRQVYKHIRIATAIADENQRELIKHHFVEEIELEEEFNAGKFGIIGRERINDIINRGKMPIVVGGSGLYIKSLIDGLFEIDSVDIQIREKLNHTLKEKGKEYIYNELYKVDPETALKLKPYYFRRVIRALEVYYQTGESISKLQKNKPEINFESLQIGLNVDRKFLYEKINFRVDEMIKKGLVDEIAELHKRGYNYREFNSLNTVGIKEVFQYLEKQFTYEEMIEEIKQNTRRYAKRQMTWFRKDDRIKWININEDTSDLDVLNFIEKEWEKFLYG